jgi:serine/threonine kinase PknH
MGSVYEAEDTVLQRSVALKLISANYAQDPDYRMRLQREARIAGRLQDPHVVPIHSAGEIDGQLYVDMRLINGTDLDTVLKRSGPLAPARAVAIVSQVAAALDDAHAAGVLHRDVKPANILLTSNDFAYLVDFGIANAAAETKLTQMGDVLGTWTYMAPERFSGNNAEVAAGADVYALACLLFEALTGSPPFTGDRVSVISAHLTQPIPRVSATRPLPVALDDVFARGMAKRPQDRYATAGELARAAELALGSGAMSVPTSPVLTAPVYPPQPTQPRGWGPPPPTPPPGYAVASAPPAPPPAPRGRKRWPFVAAAIALVVALVGAVGIWQLMKSDGAEKDSVATIDLSKLDVGRYETQPRNIPAKATPEEGRYLEAYRLAEAMANPYDVAHEYSFIYGNAVPDPELAATLISGNSTPIIQPVLEKYGMISAFAVRGYSVREADFGSKADERGMIDMVTSYPNADAAKRAAADIDAADFAVNPANQATSIPGYPQAHAHYEPSSASVAATMAAGDLVVSIIAVDGLATDVSQLTKVVAKIFDEQEPLMTGFQTTVEPSLTALPTDSDRMLSRVFVAGDLPPISAEFGTRGPRAAIECAGSADVIDGNYDEAGVDRCTGSPDGQLLRAKDEDAAKALLPKLVDADRDVYIEKDIAGPDGLSSDIAKCYEQKQRFWKDNESARYVCQVTYGRYIGLVYSGEEKDVRQRAAAQYAILANGS